MDFNKLFATIKAEQEAKQDCEEEFSNTYYPIIKGAFEAIKASGLIKKPLFITSPEKKRLSGSIVSGSLYNPAFSLHIDKNTFTGEIEYVSTRYYYYMNGNLRGSYNDRCKTLEEAVESFMKGVMNQ